MVMDLQSPGEPAPAPVLPAPGWYQPDSLTCSLSGKAPRADDLGLASGTWPRVFLLTCCPYKPSGMRNHPGSQVVRNESRAEFGRRTVERGPWVHRETMCAWPWLPAPQRLVVARFTTQPNAPCGVRPLPASPSRRLWPRPAPRAAGLRAAAPTLAAGPRLGPPTSLAGTRQTSTLRGDTASPQNLQFPK